MPSFLVKQENTDENNSLLFYKMGCVGGRSMCLTGAGPLTQAPPSSRHTVGLLL